jgi:folate-dependent phosphoribosylglycinamide formyltransferase PurN
LDTPKTLAKKILTQEHKLYPAAIMKIISPWRKNLFQFLRFQHYPTHVQNFYQ